MLNQKKIRVMTRLAAIEQKEEKNALRLTKYFRMDYVRFELLKTMIAVTAGYAVIVIMAMIYHAEEWMQNFMKINYQEIAWKIGTGYVGILLVYAIFSIIGYWIKYNAESKKVKRYLQLLHLYQKVCKEEGRRWKS